MWVSHSIRKRIMSNSSGFQPVITLLYQSNLCYNFKTKPPPGKDPVYCVHTDVEDTYYNHQKRKACTYFGKVIVLDDSNVDTGC